MLFRIAAMIGLLLTLGMVPGCNGPDPDDNLPDNGSNTNENTEPPPPEFFGVISGQLTVVPDEARSSIVETEPNDVIADSTKPIPLQAGSRLEIFGDLSVVEGDLSDTFVFRLKGKSALAVQAILSFDFNPENPSENDLVMGFSDLKSESCTFNIDGLSFTECVDGRETDPDTPGSETNPEVASFEVSGDFALSVQILAGQAGYVLGLEVSALDAKSKPNDDGTSSRNRTAKKRLPGESIVAGEVLVRFNHNVPDDQRKAIIDSHGLTLIEKSPSGVYRLGQRAPAAGGASSKAVDTMRVIEKLRSLPQVHYAEPNYIFQTALEPNDEHYDKQWHYRLINLPDAWEKTVGDPDVIIAVVDTGVILDHPDISDRVIEGFDFISDPGTALDGDGRDPDPYDVGDQSGGPGRSSFHGTHVSGTIGASSDNTRDVAGVTWACSIMPLRALGKGGGATTDIAAAVRYAAGLPNASGALPDRRADVINMSIATPASILPPAGSQVMCEAITEAVAAGVVVVVAAGNDGSTLPAFPGACSDSISVAACDAQFDLAPYSNHGTTIDLTAPGGNLARDLTGDGFGDGVLSLIGSEEGGTITPKLSFQHGTSMATPHVAGVVGLMKSVCPTLTVAEVEQILKDTAIDVGDPGPDSTFGAGVLNAAGAVNEAVVACNGPPPTEPRMSLSTAALDFGTSLDQLVVHVTNTGIGILNITDIQVETFIGEGWLTVQSTVSSGSSSISQVKAIVNRSDLPEGTYIGRITITPDNLEPRSLEVEMRVGQAGVVEDTIFVVAIDSETRVSIAQDVTDAVRGFAYEITNLPPDTYKVYAGSDRDKDDEICDLGELCGGYPSAIDANEIPLGENESRSGIDFAVGDIIFEADTPEKAGRNVIRRLD